MLVLRVCTHGDTNICVLYDDDGGCLAVEEKNDIK